MAAAKPPSQPARVLQQRDQPRLPSQAQRPAAARVPARLHEPPPQSVASGGRQVPHARRVRRGRRRAARVRKGQALAHAPRALAASRAYGLCRHAGRRSVLQLPRAARCGATVRLSLSLSLKPKPKPDPDPKPKPDPGPKPKPDPDPKPKPEPDPKPKPEPEPKRCRLPSRATHSAEAIAMEKQPGTSGAGGAARRLCESGSTWRHMPAPMLAQVYSP